MIYLLRHGLDDESKVGGYSDVSLTDIGIKQVESIAEYIKKNLEIKKIYTSDIKRTIQTAELINQWLNVDIIKDSNLRELDKGILTGKKKKELNSWERANLETKDINEKILGGESMKDLYYRIYNLYTTGYFNDKNGSLLVTHRGVINMIYAMFNQDELTMNKEKYGVEYASLHSMDRKKQKIKKIGGYNESN